MNEVLIKCKEGTIVAFLSNEKQEWFTGIVAYINLADKNDFLIQINLIVPIEPQWYSDSDKTVYYNGDFDKIVILE